MSPDETMADRRAEPRALFERSDAPARGIAYAILGLFAGIAVSALFVAGMLYSFAPEHAGRTLAPPQGSPINPDAPPLEIAPIADGAAVRANAKRKLEGYGWADRSAGLARIPIERAMELMARRGWPDDAAKASP